VGNDKLSEGSKVFSCNELVFLQLLVYYVLEVSDPARALSLPSACFVVIPHRR
jgi:hypothetical protein